MSAHSGPITAAAALKRLKAGNKRFLAGKARFSTVQKELLASLAREQRPYATILGCSDSRVPPELLFDAHFGELFVIRVAGNVFSPEVAGSLQYAAAHLHTRLMVVMGHENCGAIKAALGVKFRADRHRTHIQKLVGAILPALEGIRAPKSKENPLAAAVEANVRWTVLRINEAMLAEGRAAVAAGTIIVAGAVCELSTGRVRFLNKP